MGQFEMRLVSLGCCSASSVAPLLAEPKKQPGWPASRLAAAVVKSHSRGFFAAVSTLHIADHTDRLQIWPHSTNTHNIDDSLFFRRIRFNLRRCHPSHVVGSDRIHRQTR